MAGFSALYSVIMILPSFFGKPMNQPLAMLKSAVTQMGRQIWPGTPRYEQPAQIAASRYWVLPGLMDGISAPLSHTDHQRLNAAYHMSGSGPGSRGSGSHCATLSGSAW